MLAHCVFPILQASTVFAINNTLRIMLTLDGLCYLHFTFFF